MFSAFIATSLDGFIARRDGGIDWLDLVASPGEDYGFAAFYATIDTLVMGRGTYDKVLTFAQWPYPGKRVIVLTHRAPEPRHGETFFAGAVTELATLPGRTYVDGGNVIRQFLAANLLDDLTLSIIPVLLGDGIRLFDVGTGEHRLALAEHRAYPSGLVQLRYRTAATRDP